MNTQKFNWILYLIGIAIVTTLGVQLYWNYTNFKQNKQRILNEIQLSLDNTVEAYYADLSEKNLMTIVKPKKPKELKTKIEITSISSDKKDFDIDKIMTVINDIDKEVPSSQFTKDETQIKPNRIGGIKIYKGKKASDSLKLIKGLQTIFISIKSDTLINKTFDSILKRQLTQKSIHINYKYDFYKKDSLQKSYPENINFKTFKTINAKSTFLIDSKRIELSYTNPTKDALLRSTTGIILSFLLSIAVIVSLFYLLKIINQQKQLSEIKNDLISNITHEFKTPITTANSALEAITDFRMIDNKEKTLNYISIAKKQQEKLQVMVEKFLETATLSNEEVQLQREPTEIHHFLNEVIAKFKLITDKTIHFNNEITQKALPIDTFHFENAISNLIDNAIKYGGDVITIYVKDTNGIQIQINDNGNGIPKAHQDKIFDKFYRIPKGNTHNVKGFGIGLYYTKTIIEKHKGTISVDSTPKNTNFTITFTDV